MQRAKGIYKKESGNIYRRLGKELDVREIPLYRGIGKDKYIISLAQVDDKDYDFLTQWRWNVLVNKYTTYALRHENGKRKPGCRRVHKTIYMHREILERHSSDSIGLEVDHKDGNGLNNRLSNLRFVTHRQNSQNFVNLKTKFSSKYAGVCWSKRSKKYKTALRVDGRIKHLGYFSNEEDAAQAYRDKVRELKEKMARIINRRNL